MPGHKSNTLRIFQSTPSARRATSVHRCSISGHIYFNPRPPRGGRLHRLLHSASRRTISIHALREEGDYEYFDAGLVGHGISIHALREEGDGPAGFFFLQILHFNPRPPRGGRQRILRNRPVVDDISIHALREEGDSWSRRNPPRPRNFNPRPPRGGRPILSLPSAFALQFQSTPSARRATTTGLTNMLGSAISIHALREEGDTKINRLCAFLLPISIHALREEGDCLDLSGSHDAVLISIHALREEGDPSRVVALSALPSISIHALREEGDPRTECFTIKNI